MHFSKRIKSHRKNWNQWLLYKGMTHLLLTSRWHLRYQNTSKYCHKCIGSGSLLYFITRLWFYSCNAKHQKNRKLINVNQWMLQGVLTPSKACSTWQSAHRQTPGLHLQWVRICFLQPGVLQTYCWYLFLADVSHSVPVHCFAKCGAFIIVWSVWGLFRVWTCPAAASKSIYLL